MPNLDSIFFKAETVTANKKLSSQNYGFPVVMYGCESWDTKKAQHQRIYAF